MSNSNSTLIYLDTNVYSRPFDDQAQIDIQEEADAFLEIVREIEAGRFVLLCSDILEFEVHHILDKEKRAQIEDYLGLCTEHIDSSEAVLKLGKKFQSKCRIRARDALHIASAVPSRSHAPAWERKPDAPRHRVLTSVARMSRIAFYHQREMTL